MGLRGPGASRARLAREHLAENGLRELPWDDPGLSRVERIVAFLKWLPITKGKLAGTRMQLLPDQLRFVEDVYSREGDDRVRIAVKSEPRGNGKTGLVAGLALCHLLGPEAEPRGEVYSAAIDRQQAGLIFNEMEAIIMAVPEFAARVNIIRHYQEDRGDRRRRHRVDLRGAVGGCAAGARPGAVVLGLRRAGAGEGPRCCSTICRRRWASASARSGW